MCGIFATTRPVDGKMMDKVLESMKHRGPDEGKHVDVNAFHLGHQRLSIVGLEDGIQPITNAGENKWLVCNGEIYNHLQLKKEDLKGEEFLTHSDSEAVLKLYEKEGAGSIEKLDGMFGYFIADVENNTFVAGRDTLGIKPLYYGRDEEGHYYFSSELKTLYLLIDDAHEFPHGHYFTPEKGFVAYRKIEAPKIDEPNHDWEVHTEVIRENLVGAVKKRLMADVEVGVLLSGGLDSSLIAAIANEYTDKPIKSFCVGSEGSADILRAREVAEYLGTDHYEYIYTQEELVEAMEHVIYHLESYEPSLVRSAVPNYFVSKLAASKVKVILSGEGADELFAGYQYLSEYQDTNKLNEEIVRMLNVLHFVNLQRADRMSMAHSLELRVPFLDLKVIEDALKIPADLKVHKKDRMEKWLLRKAFDGWIPENVLWRTKEEFSEGSGALDVLDSYASEVFSDVEFERIQKEYSVPLRSKQEALYYRIFKKHFPQQSALDSVGKWATA
ncbi:asparagine synthase B [Alteribacter natronophilus]|uniref:asparagine synthase B n=1 Tax=Alteribacter natronophilus TaxID=2583810 RepID=UPI00110D7F00|nr:asparagine synthase B [Alteribacter natronophilus]TMW70316.1 asparagine synthase B [Alteribacter natronophilus]